jgi:dTDP-glucose 4,6-dehydratase
MTSLDITDMGSDVIVVTGGAGFIGSAVIRHLIREGGASIVNVDALTYAVNPANLAELEGHPRYRFERVDIRSAAEVARIFSAYRPTAVLHLAAETHVDRSIADPRVFVETNVFGTLTLLQSACHYWRSLPPGARFRFHHVSTDEVFGSLGPTGSFREDSPHRPSSPYAASKAGADHLVHAWHRTYGLPIIVSNCSNNRPVPVSREIHPLDDSQCAQGKADANLWARRETFATGCSWTITRAHWR